MHWPELFPDQDYHFHLRLERGDPARFFGRSAEAEAVLADRRRWLRETPERCLVFLPEAQPVVEETIALARSWNTLIENAQDAPAPSREPNAFNLASLAWNLEPDFVLLQPDATGSLRLVAAAVCFPSSWDVTEKAGLTVDQIHGVVPALNSELGDSIRVFLSRLRPGVAWQRANWGLSASAERNQHPSRNLQRLQPPLQPDHVFVRLEYQALVALPATRGVLFGIRLESVSLTQVREHAAARRGLRRALQTLSEPMAQYKNVAHVRAELLELLA